MTEPPQQRKSKVVAWVKLADESLQQTFKFNILADFVEHMLPLVAGTVLRVQHMVSMGVAEGRVSDARSLVTDHWSRSAGKETRSLWCGPGRTRTE